jgi:hypothetical protein
MFEVYLKALRERNRLVTETMLHNQQLVADLFSRNLDFGAEFLRHQLRVLSIVTQWRDPPPPSAEPSAGAEPTAGAPDRPKPKLKIVQTRR